MCFLQMFIEANEQLCDNRSQGIRLWKTKNISGVFGLTHSLTHSLTKKAYWILFPYSQVSGSTISLPVFL